MVQDIRELNRSAVLTELMSLRPATRKQIAESTGISAATVTRAIDQLIADGIVCEVSEVVVEKRGRRAILLDLVAERSLVVGVDLGASSTRIIGGDLLANPVVAVELPTPSELGAAELALWLAQQAKSAVGARWSAVAAVSLGLPGAVDQVERSVSNAPNLKQVEDPAFLAVCELALGVPLLADNDANLALLGELRFGAARHTPYAAMLSLGAGLGVGIAIDGAILRGRHGLVGEFGQIPVGALGERLESFTTGPGLMARAAAAGVPLESPARLFEASGGEGGGSADSPTTQLRADFDRALVTVLTAIAVSSEPETIVLGGGIAKSLVGDLGRYQERLEQTIRIAPTLTSAELGDFSGAAGGVVSALHTVYLTLGVEQAALSALPKTDLLTPTSIRRIFNQMIE
ncbi:ROK family transcriptional regulator [Herbiconiux sp. CPCC 203407]|uniref:ROK family transcriptional regulator n=1 Tax=Herbiconiux oxytropis TaxID=2970915 RepID=A0AA41XEV2_9MICO|nr:ROK family transcriptional regulator [Herbiconiux oxytropis]MCS5720754.1 ROK family transcriptional regulator [Herbiconiux oxytropis]MCS5724919.1 ROK family transcriptional regulator [Herbiconiux oxytropis]